MKEPIYNAIQKQLIIDGDDSPLNYQHTSINNEVIKYADTLEELYQIYCNNCSDIFSYNTINCFSFILKDNTEISMHKYRKQMKPLFLKISDKSLGPSNSILIALDKKYMQIEKLSWQDRGNYNLNTKYDYLESFENMTDGYENCQRMLRVGAVQHKNFPAINYCNDIVIKNKGITYQGYLPAIKQHAIIAKYISMLEYVRCCICGNDNPLITKPYWSSTEAYETYHYEQHAYAALYYKDRQENYHMAMYYYRKNDEYYVFPIFHKM